MRRRVLLALVWAALSGVVLAGAGCGRGGLDAMEEKYSTLNPPGADFTLTDQDGKPFHLSDHRGQAVLLFFGYLSCPDVCPTTLAKLAGVYSRLGPRRRAKVLTLFVSFDTKRDSPVKLKQYLSYYGLNAVGLTGTQAQVDQVVSDYKASYTKVETRSAIGYLYNHSDIVYLIDPRGKVVGLFHADDGADAIASAVKDVL